MDRNYERQVMRWYVDRGAYRALYHGFNNVVSTNNLSKRESVALGANIIYSVFKRDEHYNSRGKCVERRGSKHKEIEAVFRLLLDILFLYSMSHQ